MRGTDFRLCPPPALRLPGIDAEFVSRVSSGLHLDCGDGGVQERVEALASDVFAVMRPAAAMGWCASDALFKDLGFCADEDGTAVSLLTLGKGPDVLEEVCCSEGRYLDSLILDFICGICIFSFENQVERALEECLKKEGRALSKRVEIPGDLPALAQGAVLRLLDKEGRLGVGLTDSFMFTPLKTMSSCFTLRSAVSCTGVVPGEAGRQGCAQGSCRGASDCPFGQVCTR